MASFLLGVDIGGTGAKAGLVSSDGKMVGSGYAEYRMISRVPGQAEHDAEEWWQATRRAIRQATREVNPHDIAAVGVSCTNGLIAVDAQGRPLRHAIMLWDQRTLSQVQRIRETVDPEEVFRVTGNPVAPGAYSLPSLLWLMDHEPGTFQETHKVMVPGGYIIARLTGEFTIDYSRACTTLLFDIRAHEWHSPFLDVFAIPREKLPQPLASNEFAGTINAAASELTGLALGTPVVAGCMDSVSASLGSGVLRRGEGFIIMGTAARVCSPLNEARFDARFMNCTHVLPDLWLSIGALNGIGSSLRWVRDTFGQLESSAASLVEMDVYDLLTAQAMHSPPGSKGLIYLPYLAGERTPIWDPYARGVLFGMTLAHTRQDVLHAILEGTAFAIRQAVELLEANLTHSVHNLRIGGSAAASEVWNQIIANVLGKPIERLKQAHTEVLGAALLAGVSAGVYANYGEASEAAVHAGERFEPDLEAHAAYNELFPIYLELYPLLKPYFERLAHLDLPQVWVTKGG